MTTQHKLLRTTVPGIAAAGALGLSIFGVPPVFADEAPVTGAYFTTMSQAPFEEGESVGLQIENDSISLHGTCNTLIGKPTWSAGTLTVSEVVSTEIGCDTDSAEEDAWLASWWSAALSYTLDDNRLTITDGTTSLSFDPDYILYAAGPKGLARTSWKLQRFGTAGALKKSRPLGLRIKADGVTFKTGCNSAWASATITPTRLKLGPVFSTRVGCSGSAARLEQRVFATLRGVVTVRRTGDKLVLRRGKNMLVYRAAAA